MQLRTHKQGQQSLQQQNPYPHARHDPGRGDQGGGGVRGAGVAKAENHRQHILIKGGYPKRLARDMNPHTGGGVFQPGGRYRQQIGQKGYAQELGEKGSGYAPVRQPCPGKRAVGKRQIPDKAVRHKNPRRHVTTTDRNRPNR